MTTNVTPWASVKGGKWHRTEAMAANFSDTVSAPCGVTFVPYNVQEPKPFPDGVRHTAICAHCYPTKQGDMT